MAGLYLCSSRDLRYHPLLWGVAMDNRKSTTDRRADQAKAWKTIMADVKKVTDTADRMDRHLHDLRRAVDRMASMTTTKG